MLHIFAGALFGFAPLAALLMPHASPVSAAALQGRQAPWSNLPSNLTTDVLMVANAISTFCATNLNCTALTTTVIPRCERLQGDPGCWCGNHDPLHYCAICMSTPENNQTSAQQTQDALAGHQAYHQACTAYELILNGTTATTSSESPSSTSSAMVASPTVVASNEGSSNKTPIGPIVGGAVGGLVGLALIGGAIYLISLMIKKRGNSDVAPSSISYMSNEYKSPGGFSAPYPHTSMAHYGSPGHVSPLPNAGYTNNPEPMTPPYPTSQQPVQN